MSDYLSGLLFSEHLSLYVHEIGSDQDCRLCKAWLLVRSLEDADRFNRSGQLPPANGDAFEQDGPEV